MMTTAPRRRLGRIAPLLALLTALCGSSHAAGRWPLSIQLPVGTFTMYSPQVQSVQGDMLRVAAAVSVKLTDVPEPVYGSIALAARMVTARASREVFFDEIKVLRVTFPGGDSERQERLSRFLEGEIPKWNVVASLDDVTLQIALLQEKQAMAEELDDTPPVIIVADRPSVLVTLDGDPILSRTADGRLERVVNTPFLIARETGKQTSYLKGGQTWYSAPSPLGPWRPGASVPDALQALVAAEFVVPPSTDAMTSSTNMFGPEVIMTTQTAELIQSNGPPEMAPLGAGKLSAVVNSPNDWFHDGESGRHYVLLSGRWFSAADPGGPWSYVDPVRLPASFAAIPADSEKGHVLACVAGTTQALTAIAELSVPQTAVVARKGAAINVAYDGPPIFSAVEGTELMVAENTACAVLLVAGKYYCCEDGVWYQSAGARGPWTVATSVPDPIYLLPPNCPIQHVKYARVFGATDDLVYCGYTPGYTGSIAHKGTVVYGTGYRYAAWKGNRYHARARTYGFGAQYDPVSAAWSYSPGCMAVAGGGWKPLLVQVGQGWIGGTTANSTNWWGVGGYNLVSIRHREGLRVADTSLLNLYARRDLFTRDDFSGEHPDLFAHLKRRAQSPASGEPVSPGGGAIAALLGVSLRTYQTPLERMRKAAPETANLPVEQPRVPTPSATDDDILTDDEGNLYREKDDGMWQKWDGKQWQDFYRYEGPLVHGGKLAETMQSTVRRPSGQLTSTQVQAEPRPAPMSPEQRVARLQVQSEVRQHVEQSAGEAAPQRRTVFRRGSGWLPETSDVYETPDQSTTRRVFKRDGQPMADKDPIVDVNEGSPTPTVFRRGSGYLMKNSPIESPFESSAQKGPFKR